MRYEQQERLKNIVKKEAEEEEKKPAADRVEEQEAKEQQQDDKQYDTVTKIKLLYERKRLKGFRVTRNLNRPNTKTIMASITRHIEMKVKVIYSFKSVIYRSDGEIKPCSKTLDSAPGMFTSLKEIQAYIEECEQKWLACNKHGIIGRSLFLH